MTRRDALAVLAALPSVNVRRLDVTAKTAICIETERALSLAEREQLRAQVTRVFPDTPVLVLDRWLHLSTLECAPHVKGTRG